MGLNIRIGIEGVGDAGVLSRRCALVEPSGNEYPIDGCGWVLYNTHYHNLNYLSLEVYEVLRQGTGNRGVAE